MLFVLYVYVVLLIYFQKKHVQIHKSTPLLSIFSLKVQWTRDSIKKRGLKSLVFLTSQNAL